MKESWHGIVTFYVYSIYGPKEVDSNGKRELQVQLVENCFKYW